MSLQSLLANDTVTVQQRAASRRDASGGLAAGGWGAVPGMLPTTTLTNGSTASGPFNARVEDQTASQTLAYAMRGMNVGTVVFTQQGGIGAGMLFNTSDGRVLMVEGSISNRQLGGIPTYYQYVCSEYRVGA